MAENDNIHFRKSQNNPYQEIDDTKEKERIEAAIALNKNKSFDRETVRFIVSKKPASYAMITDITDAHDGSVGSDAEREEIAKHLAAEPYISELIYGGDSVDNAVAGGATDPSDSKLSPSVMIEVGIKNGEPLVHKTVAYIGGNHDAYWGNRNRAGNMSPSRNIADALGVEYVPFMLIYKIPLLTPDNLEVKYLNLAVVHSNVKANKFSVTDASLKMVLGKCFEQGVCVDVIETEHMHSGSEGLNMIAVPSYDDNGKRLGDVIKPVYVVNGKSFQNGNTTYGGINLFTNKTNLKSILMNWKLNPNYTKAVANIEPKYFPNAIPFNVLKENSNEPSEMMKRVLKLYSLPDMTKFKEDLKKKDLTDVASKYKQAKESYFDEMFKYATIKKMARNKAKQGKNVKETAVEVEENAKVER